MIHLRQSRALWAALLASALCISGTESGAQEKSRGTAVVYPVVFAPKTGTDTSRATAVTAIEESLQKAGYTLISGTVATNTWKRMRLPRPRVGEPARRSELVRFGNELKARYVVAPIISFRTRSIWVDFGPKTISTATVDIVITDTQLEKAVYTRRGVQGRSDEKFDALKSAGAILITPLFTIVSGGPKTPQEQRAAQIAVVRAMKDWVATGAEPNSRR